MNDGIGRSELLGALRKLAEAFGHEGAGPNRCEFRSGGCTCGRAESARVALAAAWRILREAELNS